MWSVHSFTSAPLLAPMVEVTFHPLIQLYRKIKPLGCTCILLNVETHFKKAQAPIRTNLPSGVRKLQREQKRDVGSTQFLRREFSPNACPKEINQLKWNFRVLLQWASPFVRRISCEDSRLEAKHQQLLCLPRKVGGHVLQARQ